MNSGAETSRNSVKTNGGWLPAKSVGLRHVVNTTGSTSMGYSTILRLLYVVTTVGKCPGSHVYSLADDSHAVSTHPQTFHIYRLMWHNERIPPELVRGMFVKLHKKGPRDDSGTTEQSASCVTPTS